MKVIVSRAALIAPLLLCASIANARSIPVLGCVRLVAEGSRLTLLTTDLDLRVSHGIELDVEAQPGTACVEASRLLDVVRKLSDDAVITGSVTKDGRFSLVSGNSKYMLPTMPLDDFPDANIPEVEGISVPTETLDSMLERVQHCILRSDISRPMMGGVHLEVVDGVMRATATDGHRLGRVTIQSAGNAPAVIVPFRALAIMAKVLGSGGDAFVTTNQNSVTVRVGDGAVWSKVVDGDFPDMDRVIPSSPTSSLVMDRAQLLSAIERLSGVGREDPRRRFVRCEPERGALRISIASVGAEGEEVVAAEVTGECEAFGVNPDYLREALSVMDGDRVNVRVTGPHNPLLLEDAASLQDVHVIMPVRV